MGLSGAISSLVCGWIVRHGKRLGVLDDPAKHKHPKVVHTEAVPRGGGWPILAAVAIGGVIFLPWEIKLWGIIGGAVILAVTGFADDKYEEKVSPYLRLVLNGLAALAVIGTGVGVAFITNPLGGVIRLDWPQLCFSLWGARHCIWVLSDLFALGWLMWMQNIVGWSSGVDGQLPGFVVVAALTVAALATRFADPSQTGVVLLAGIVAGAYLGFLPWNWYPQKMMPGYGGKSLAGFLLGVLAIMSQAKVGAMMMVLAVPMVDAVLVIVKRIKEGRSPVWGGWDHLHHYLLDRGWSKKQVALFYWGAAAVMAILALQLKPPSKYFTIAAIGLIFGGIILWLHYFSTFSKPPGRDNG